MAPGRDNAITPQTLTGALRYFSDYDVCEALLVALCWYSQEATA